MFSPTEIDHVAWFLLLLMAGWLLVNVLVDLSSDRPIFRNSKKATKHQNKHRD